MIQDKNSTAGGWVFLFDIANCPWTLKNDGLTREKDRRKILHDEQVPVQVWQYSNKTDMYRMVLVPPRRTGHGANIKIIYPK